MNQNILKLIFEKLSFLLLFGLLMNGLPASASEFDTILCLEKSGKIARDSGRDRDYKGRYYNRDGSDGRDGRSGRNGRSGRDATVFADGSPVSLDLSGRDGEDGEDGEDGDRPRCRRRYSNKVKRNIHAADGGKGGDAGSGGNGGSGGLLTVYYSNIADLKSILVRSQGGEGGRGGRGGDGAIGCRCRRRSWTVKSCKGKKGTDNYKCKKRKYRCYQGSDGRDGYDGKDGKQGNNGFLSLVKGKQQLKADNPQAELSFVELNGKSIRLSKNRWISRNGAASLLAPGSIIADKYREFDKRIERDFQVVWREKQPINNFSKAKIKLNLNNDGKIEVDSPQKLWLDISKNQENDLTKLVVNHAIPEKEVTELKPADFVGSGENLTVSIVDLAGRSDIIKTRFKVEYEVRDDNGDEYEADIPPELVTKDYNRFTLALGKLPIIPKQGLEVGTKVRIKVTAIRSLGNRSKTQTITWKALVRER
ncbi:MAG: collagen-like protein [Rivularia sp. (in: Bacteria)]|nr:collagen-like protein [Rivularia sp. MS3]